MTDQLRVTHGAAGIFNKLRQSIINNEYTFNERMPSERALAIRYGVARGTIRSALEQLERAHFVRKRFSSGTFVCYDTKFEQVNIAEETSPLELIETRLAIEPHIIRLIISNASKKELRKLEEALENLKHGSHDANSFSSADEFFHLTLAQCSQNPLLIWIYKRINDIRSHNQWNDHKIHILTAEKIAQYNAHHTELVHYILQRNIDQAYQIIVQHLLQAKQDLLGSGHG